MDDYYDEDEATKAAVSASLKEMDSSSHGPSKPRDNNLVDLTEDSDDCPSPSPVQHSTSPVDDTELQRAIDLSLDTQASSVASNSDVPKPSDGGPQSATSAPVYGILGIDRKKQEEERLARVAKKRTAEDLSLPASARQAKTLKSDTYASVSSGPAVKPPATSVTSDPGLEYPHGTVKKTWASGYRRDDDIKIEEVLKKPDLELAVLSSFQWDMDWLFTKFDTTKTRFLLVMGAKEETMVWSTASLIGLVLLS